MDMSQNRPKRNLWRILRPESAEINSPIIEPVGSPGHAAALLARINARARARKEGLIKGTKSPSLAVKENTDTVKTDKSLKEKKFLTKDNLVRTESLLKIIKNKLKNDVSEDEQQLKKDEKDISKKNKKKKRKDIPEYDTVDSFKDDGKVVCSPSLELQPLKKKKKKRTNSENEIEHINKTENDIENNFINVNLNKVEDNNLEAQIRGKQNENEDEQKEPTKKNITTGFEDFFCITEEKECSTNNTHFENEALEVPSNKCKAEKLAMKMEMDEIESTGKDSSVKEAVKEAVIQNLPTCEEIKKRKRKKKKKNKDKDSSEKDGNNIEGFTMMGEVQTVKKGKHIIRIFASDQRGRHKHYVTMFPHLESKVKSQFPHDVPTHVMMLHKKAFHNPRNDDAEKSGAEGAPAIALHSVPTTMLRPTGRIISVKNWLRRKSLLPSKKRVSYTKEIPNPSFIKQIKINKKNQIRRMLIEYSTAKNIISQDMEIYETIINNGNIFSFIDLLRKPVLANSLFPIIDSVFPKYLETINALSYRPRDICVSAPTGSGKTLAFVLPIVQALSGRTVPRIRALVLLPVQELAIQVYKVFLTYVEHMGLNVGLAVGLKSFAKEQSSLIRKDASGYHSLVDILVATPGKLSDHLQLTKGIDLTYLRYLVLDEADRMLAADGGEWVERIEKAVSGKLSHGPLMGSFPPPGSMLALPTLPLQHLLFSATLSHDPEQLQHLTLYRPKLFTVTAQGVNLQTKDNSSEELVGVYTRPAELCEQFAVVEGTIKPLVLHHLATTNSWQRTLVFTNTTESTHKLATLLQMMAKDLTIKEFSSRHKKERKQIISQFKAGKIDMLISTDAMARGLDVPDIEQVVSYDVTSTSTYVHRIGRTARAGKTGTALSFVTKDDVGDYKNMLSQGGGIAEEISVPMEELEIYEEMYKEALFKMKDTLLQEKHNKRNENKTSVIRILQTVEGNKGKHKGRINNKQGLRKGIKRLQ
ncbi:unnamed protein product, partial [Meganyctiphanes norvegica]